MKILIVGGTFDTDNPKESTIIREIAETLGKGYGHQVNLYNGGIYSDLINIYENVIRGCDADVLIWMPNVDNSFNKMTEGLKRFNPKITLVTSKRLDGRDYSKREIISRLLKIKSNLSILIDKDEFGFTFQLVDPLGNTYCDNNLEDLIFRLENRLDFLRNEVTRMGSEVYTGDKVIPEPPEDREFFDYIQEIGKTFHDLIHPEKTERFLGNASFRCEHGFPSFKSEEGIFVSRRNVDKRKITKESFVPAWIESDWNNDPGVVKYTGNHKPSVDTPIQCRLFKYYNSMKYMVHAHVYVNGAPFTKHKFPCGAIEEVRVITNVAPCGAQDTFAVNLLGHGCLIMSKNVEELKRYTFYPRPLWED